MGGWRVQEHEPTWGSGGVALSGVQGQRPWSGGLYSLKLTTISHLNENLNNENCTLFSIIYAVNNNTICAETLIIYKLDDNDEPVIFQLFC